MVEHSKILLTIGPAFAILFTGYFLRKARWLTHEADETLTRLQFNIIYPCLILTTILGNEAVNTGSSFAIPVTVGIFNESIGLLIAFLFAGFFAVKKGTDRRTFSYATAHFNNGLIPILLVQSMFEGKSTLAVLFVHNLGIDLCYWSLGLLVLTNSLGKSWWKKVLNLPFCTLILALVLNVSGLSKFILDPSVPVLSGFIESGLGAAKLIGACTVPVGLMLAGAISYEMVRNSFGNFDWRPVVGATILRLIAIPSVFLLIAYFIPFSTELKRILVIQAAMPCGLMSIVTIHHYGGNAKIAAPLIIITNFISLATIPLVIAFGMKLVGLV